MHALPEMISDLALILGTAAVVILIFRRLRQPLVLGYLVAGFLVGPKTQFFPSAVSIENINLWAEIGVIFLLFALGLEFSFKKLLRVGGTAGVTTIFEVSIMLGLGFLTGRCLGWNSMDSLFLGGLLSMSSTSIILRTIDELGYKNLKYVSSMLGILVIEDLVAVLLMVILTTVAVSRSFNGEAMLTALLRLAFFLALWFVGGIFLLPSFMKRVQKIMNEETVLVVSVSLCFLMVVFASSVGFSAALGAFIMGSILAETIEGERIHHLIVPIKDLFSAVFFISVGMLIDIHVIAQHWWEVLLFSAVVIVGKSVSVTLGSLLSGQNLKTSVQTGMTLAQIGEFSFVIATLGLNLKVISETLYPIAVAVSVITAFTTPMTTRSGARVAQFLEKHLPKRWLRAIERYGIRSYSMNPPGQRKKLMQAYLVKILLNAVIVIAIFLSMAKLFLPFLLGKEIAPMVAKDMALAVTLLLSAPFLWAMAFGKTRDFDFLLSERKPSAAGVHIFFVSRLVVTVILLGIVVAEFVPLMWALLVTLWMVVVLGYVFSSRLKIIYQWFENRFLSNFHDSPEQNQAQQGTHQLAPWDAHMTEFRVPAEAPYAGVALSQLSLKDQFGVMIALIERGQRKIIAPEGSECLMPHDGVFVLGTDEQLIQVKSFLDARFDRSDPVEDIEYSLEQHEVSEDSDLKDRSVRDSGLREKTTGLLVGIERSGKRILNPDSNEILRAGDRLWIVGDREKILAL